MSDSGPETDVRQIEKRTAALSGRRPFACIGRRSHESFSLSCSIRSFSAFNIQNQTIPVCTQPPYYPPFALEVPAATAAGIFHFRRAAAPSCRFPVVFPSPSGCFPAAFRLSFRHPLVAFPLPFHRRPACFSCDFRLPFRRLPVASPPLSGCHSDTFRLSSRLPSRRRPVAAFLNLCRRFRDADIVRPRPFPGNPVARQNKLPGNPFGFPAECSGQPVSRPAGNPTKSSSPNPDCCIPR